MTDARQSSFATRSSTWSPSITRAHFAPTEFVPGESPSPSRRAGSSTPPRCSILVDSSLDFWLTTGRFAAQFETQFARFFGVPDCYRW